jgi:two-component system sensor histidine kinase HydH
LESLRIRPTDVLSVIERAIRLIRPQATEQRVDISLLHPPTHLPAAALDAERFEQAVLNLMINALEAMPSGGTLTMCAGVNNGTLLIEIEDSGAGITPDIQRHVFQPYFSTKGKGTGMGLAITEKIVSQHGGHIGFDTGPRGTVFRLSFPVHQDGDAT